MVASGKFFMSYPFTHLLSLHISPHSHLSSHLLPMCSLPLSSAPLSTHITSYPLLFCTASPSLLCYPFIYFYLLVFPSSSPLALCEVVAVCLKSGLIELRSGESSATSILHTHTLHTHGHKHILLFLPLFYPRYSLSHTHTQTHTHTRCSVIN